jgi:hypothetical protein
LIKHGNAILHENTTSKLVGNKSRYNYNKKPRQLILNDETTLRKPHFTGIQVLLQQSASESQTLKYTTVCDRKILILNYMQ